MRKFVSDFETDPIQCVNPAVHWDHWNNHRATKTCQINWIMLLRLPSSTSSCMGTQFKGTLHIVYSKKWASTLTSYYRMCLLLYPTNLHIVITLPCDTQCIVYVTIGPCTCMPPAKQIDEKTWRCCVAVSIHTVVLTCYSRWQSMLVQLLLQYKQKT